MFFREFARYRQISVQRYSVNDLKNRWTNLQISPVQMPVPVESGPAGVRIIPTGVWPEVIYETAVILLQKRTGNRTETKIPVQVLQHILTPELID